MEAVMNKYLSIYLFIYLGIYISISTVFIISLFIDTRVAQISCRKRKEGKFIGEYNTYELRIILLSYLSMVRINYLTFSTFPPPPPPPLFSIPLFLLL